MATIVASKVLVSNQNVFSALLVTIAKMVHPETLTQQPSVQLENSARSVKRTTRERIFMTSVTM